jgi:hypothetical protein
MSRFVVPAKAAMRSACNEFPKTEARLKNAQMAINWNDLPPVRPGGQSVSPPAGR